MHDKPLFIPLKTEYYEAFERGDKHEEIRLYGPRWNEKTCSIGRKVILSKGYGKHARMTGTIAAFHKRKGHTFGSTSRRAIEALYGSLDEDMAEIRIYDATPLTLSTS